MLANADDAEPMINEYIIKPTMVMLVVKNTSVLLRGGMSSPMPVVTCTAQNSAWEYWSPPDANAKLGCGTHLSGRPGSNQFGSVLGSTMKSNSLVVPHRQWFTKHDICGVTPGAVHTATPLYSDRTMYQ